MSKYSITSLIAVVSLLVAALPQVAEAQTGFAYETEKIAGSEIPVTYHLIMTPDGLYTPIGLRRPAGDGPFPIVLFASGNGGEGLPYVRDYSHNRGWTLEQFLEAGYAVAWLRYRAEVDMPEYGSALTSRGGSGRPRFDRAPLEYEDVIATIEYVKTLPFVDADRVGYMGMTESRPASQASPRPRHSSRGVRATRRRPPSRPSRRRRMLTTRRSSPRQSTLCAGASTRMSR
jgi:hypothetical protein